MGLYVITVFSVETLRIFFCSPDPEKPLELGFSWSNLRTAAWVPEEDSGGRFTASGGAAAASRT
jgi:hypothetical protein